MPPNRPNRTARAFDKVRRAGLRPALDSPTGMGFRFWWRTERWHTQSGPEVRAPVEGVDGFVNGPTDPHGRTRARRRPADCASRRSPGSGERQQLPNVASRRLALCCQRLSADWLARWGHPIVAVESFVDAQPFRGTAYKASGWTMLGPTSGYG